MTDTLLPCPFCGVYPVTHKVGDANAVTCEGCGASITDDGKPWKAARMWNTRTETLEAIVLERGLFIEGTIYTPERTCHSTTEETAWCFGCSECGKSFPRNELHLAHNHGEINYCPNCGARVVS